MFHRNETVILFFLNYQILFITNFVKKLYFCLWLGADYVEMKKKIVASSFEIAQTF